MFRKNGNTVQYLLLLYLCFIFIISKTYSVDLPEFIKPCPRDNRFNTCLRKLLRDIIPKLADGYPDLNLQPIDPLDIYNVPIEFIRPYIRLEGNANLSLSGLRDVQIYNIQSKFKENNMELLIDVLIPRIFVKSQYEVNGYAFNLVPVRYGNFNATLISVRTPFNIIGQKVEMDGKNYINVTNIIIDPSIYNAYFDVTDILSEPVLNNVLINVMQREWRGVYESMLPQAKYFISPNLISVANLFFLQFDLETLLPARKKLK